MAIQLNDNLYAKVNRPLDFKFGPFTNVAQANSIIPISQRYHGLLFGVYSDPLDIPNSDIEYYYYFDGLTDVNYKKLNSAVVPYIGATQDVDLGNNDIKADSFIVNSGTLSQFLKGDGSLDSNSYYLSSNPNSYITLASLSFQAGSGGYNSSTGVITIPTNNNQIINGSNFITLVSLSGSDPIQYNNTTGVISITQAGTANNGYLSSTDWNTFNNKQVAGSYLTTNTTQTITGIKVFNDFRLQLAAAGTSQPTVFQNSNSISSGSGGYNTLGFNSDSDLFFNDGTSNSVVLSFSNTTTRIYTLPDASGTLALTSQLPINPITGTIASGQVAFGTAAGVIGGDSGLFWDNVNKRLGVGTSTPSTNLHSQGSVSVGGATTGVSLSILGSGGRGGSISPRADGFGTAGLIFSLTGLASGNFAFGADILPVTYFSNNIGNSGQPWGTVWARTFRGRNNTSEGTTNLFSGTTSNPLILGIGGTENMRFSHTNGNVLIGTPTDAGFRLDVNGTARVQGELTLGGITNYSANAGLIARITGGSNIFSISSNDTLTIGTTVLTISGSVRITNGNISGRQAQSGSIYNFNRSVDGATGLANIFNYNQQATTQSGGNIRVWNIEPTFVNDSNFQSFRGIFYSPTITGLLAGTTHIAIQTVSGNTLLGTTSGSVGIGTNTSINASAILDITSTTQGFLPPRMTTTQRNAITSPAAGLIVYDTTLNKLSLYTGLVWETITSI